MRTPAANVKGGRSGRGLDPPEKQRKMKFAARRGE
jgi:hypothetical protein